MAANDNQTLKSDKLGDPIKNFMFASTTACE